jgi:hypothetical protein
MLDSRHLRESDLGVSWPRRSFRSPNLHSEFNDGSSSSWREEKSSAGVPARPPPAAVAWVKPESSLCGAAIHQRQLAALPRHAPVLVVQASGATIWLPATLLGSVAPRPFNSGMGLAPGCRLRPSAAGAARLFWGNLTVADWLAGWLAVGSTHDRGCAMSFTGATPRGRVRPARRTSFRQ